MLLYLVRHAIAGVRDAERWPDDSLRPLTAKGEKRFRQAARGAGRLVPQVDFVLSSPYRRAWDTACILEAEAGWPPPVRCDELTQPDNEAMKRVILDNASRQSLALIGHEPYLGQLASTLLSPEGGASLAFKKGAITCIRAGEPGGGSAMLLWLLQPRALRSMTR